MSAQLNFNFINLFFNSLQKKFHNHLVSILWQIVTRAENAQ